MSQQEMAWTAIGFYILVTILLTIKGAMKTKDLASFAIGSKDIPPVFVGLSLAAQLTSVATFVVNPGLIYKYGVAGLLGFAVAAPLGVMLGLVAFSRRFLTVGSRVAAVTVPQWIGKRYESPVMQTVFAFISLALIAFGVLIVVGLSYAIGQTLGIPPFLPGAGDGLAPVYNPSFTWLISAIVLFVFSYMMIGGVNTHAYTNAIQGIIMLVVAIILLASGFHLFNGQESFFARLAAIDPNLVTMTNAASPYFRNWFEIFFCNFLVGIAIVCQPHVVSKVLYLKDESQVKPYLTTAVLVGLVFSFLMIVGLYARLTLPPIDRMDLVVPTYVQATFSPLTQVVITLGIMCAGLSTLEGLLLSLSTIFSTDIFLPLFRKSSPAGVPADEIALSARALKYGRGLLVLTALLIIWLSVGQVKNPVGGSVAIFGMYGVYFLFTTTFFPLAAGMFLPQVGSTPVFAGVIASGLTYVGIAIFKISHMHNNPAFLATMAIIIGWSAVFIVHQTAGKTAAPATA
jgi:Na+/pantothenate symporter